MKYILERYCILLYRGALRKTVHRKNRKQIPLIRSGSILVDLDRLRLCTFSFAIHPWSENRPFHCVSSPEIFPRFYLVWHFVANRTIPRVPSPRKGLGMHSKLDLVRVRSTNEILFLLPSMRVFVSFERGEIFFFRIIRLVSTERKYFRKIDTPDQKYTFTCVSIIWRDKSVRHFRIMWYR